jgi:hypothetical protein
MNIKGLFREAFVALTRNWLRSVLTILSISVGVGALRLFGADLGLLELGAPSGGKLTAGLNIGLLLRESVESVAYNQDPGRGKEGIHDYGQAEAR